MFYNQCNNINPVNSSFLHMFAYFPHDLPGPPRFGLPGSFPLPPHRKRGGQPGNSNAYRHGIYSARSPQPQVTTTKPVSVQKDPSIIQKGLQERLIASCKNELRENRLKLGYGLAVSMHGLPPNEMLSQVRAATILVGINLKIIRALHELGGRQAYLLSLVRDLPALLRWKFHEWGIPARPPFVPRKLVILNANLGWEAPHLTDSQWSLLQKSFISLHADLDYFRKYRRRKPLPSDRFLLEGILWKLANGLRWRDLAGKYPVRRCQELYSALFRSGRMQTINNRLLGYLDVQGESTLRSLVERGCFVISGNRVLLAPSEKLNWEKYTALLLLQQAYHVRRSIKLEDDRDRRRQGGYLRLPSFKVPGSPPRSACSLSHSPLSSNLTTPCLHFPVNFSDSFPPIDSPPAGGLIFTDGGSPP